MDVSIERAAADDAPALVQAQIAAFHYDAVLYPGVEIGGPPGYDSTAEMLRLMREGECYKILAGGRCVGGMVIFDMGNGHFHLGVIFLEPAYQNRGIGTQAMQFIEDTYPASRWTLDTPTWAVRNHHFYEKFGYLNVGEHSDGDTPLIVYEKRSARDRQTVEETTMNVWDAIRSKRAVRRFTPEPLPQDVVERILDAGRRAQSSKNSQPWHFVAVRDRDTLQKLSTLGDWMGHVAGAALCVVIVIPATPNDRHPWHMFDTGQSAAYMQLAALEMGVGSCLGTIYRPDDARALLNLPPDREARIVISFGYPDPDQGRAGAGKAGRRPLAEVVHWDVW